MYQTIKKLIWYPFWWSVLLITSPINLPVTFITSKDWGEFKDTLHEGIFILDDM